MAKSDVLAKVDADLDRGHTHLAAQRLNSLIAADPYDLGLRARLAAVHRRTGNLAEAGRWGYLTEDVTPAELAAFDKAYYRSAPDQLRALILRGEQPRGLGRLAAARFAELTDRAASPAAPPPSTPSPSPAAPPPAGPLSDAPLPAVRLSDAPLPAVRLSDAPLPAVPLSDAPLPDAPLPDAPLSDAPLPGRPLSAGPPAPWVAPAPDPVPAAPARRASQPPVDDNGATVAVIFLLLVAFAVIGVVTVVRWFL
ncbi:hypothetical protein Aph02nite_02870 [Actinoplanes philippinensis]|uniref:Uncharacterized protein n=1 Tax=Actinoplanes philippinensis TaxID=35752 RepID=A0A1I2DC91_9ACTN|nr:DUF6584 family protein [Actinoplanes philippinensis]GIE74337.1 hypothetical protein Aph02nite_02870 [Actinoplanes philippinensis]SFE78079.1 hypothetical protein SAMN05421541_103542 [Actinoplanes philippinensis]